MSAVPHRRLMSQAEYAALRGVSRQAIGKLVRQGKLSLIDGKIDADLADTQLQRDLNPARSKTLSALAASRDGAPAGGPHVASSAAPANAPAAAATGSGVVVDINTYHGARAMREKMEALRAHLEYERQRGSLVDLDGARRAAIDASRALRDALMSVPVRIGPGLADVSDPAEIVRMLEAEMRRVLDGLSKSLAASMARLEA